MSRRTQGLLATFALVVSGLVALGASTAPAATAAFDDPVPLCSAPHAPPCLTLFQRNGVPNPAGYRVAWNEQAGADGFYSWMVEKLIDSSWRTDMGVDEQSNTFTVAFNFGDFNPRTVGGQGAPVATDPVVWWTSSGDHFVKITATPVHRVLGCFYPSGSDTATCPTTAEPQNELFGYLDGVVNNANWFGETEAEHQLIAGFYNFRSAELGESAPIQYTDPVTGDQQLVFHLQNVHENAAHALFHGFQQLRLPNAMLKEIYRIPDPDTMTSGSLATTITGGVGTITIHPEDGHDAMIVDLSDVTFSTRTVRVKTATIVPTAPSHLKSWRISSTSGRIYFVKSYPRGARVTGYSARCANGSTIKTATGTSAGVTFTNLGAGKPYACRVRAKSKAGYGPWSAVVRFASTP